MRGRQCVPLPSGEPTQEALFDVLSQLPPWSRLEVRKNVLLSLPPVGEVEHQPLQLLYELGLVPDPELAATQAAVDAETTMTAPE